MIQNNQLDHIFVTTFPDVLAPSTLYVSMEFGTVAHYCCCGCGAEIITPLTPTDWQLNYDGETISLHPSIGNWDLPCRSHYVIRRGLVIKAGAWSEDQVMNERNRDKKAKAVFYNTATVIEDDMESAALELSEGKISWWKRIKHLFFS